MTVVNIPPLSVNRAWQGQRFKTPAYKAFEKEVLYTLRPIYLPKAPYRVNLEYGFSSANSDVDNPTKMILDILQKKYGFNDKLIQELHIKKTHVKKGSEYFSFEILSA